MLSSRSCPVVLPWNMTGFKMLQQWNMTMMHNRDGVKYGYWEIKTGAKRWSRVEKDSYYWGQVVISNTKYFLLYTTTWLLGANDLVALSWYLTSTAKSHMLQSPNWEMHFHMVLEISNLLEYSVHPMLSHLFCVHTRHENRNTQFSRGVSQGHQGASRGITGHQLPVF